MGEDKLLDTPHNEKVNSEQSIVRSKKQDSQLPDDSTNDDLRYLRAISVNGEM